MRDRQLFDTTKAPNGITVHKYITDDPFVIFSIFIPIGTVHAGTDTPFGTAHFHEHMTMHRSKFHQDKDAFLKWVGEIGGCINAQTHPFSTTYTIQVATEYAEDAWKGFVSLVFEPVFIENDLINERSIISNERDQQKWYPGDTELSSYLWSSWLSAEITSKQQLFGSDDDLSQISIAVLEEFEKKYHNQNVHIIVAGGIQENSFNKIINDVSKIPTTQLSILENFKPFQWVNKSFSTHTFTDIESPIYFTGVHHPLPNNQERIALQFLFEYLTDIYTGPLYAWLRYEKGWSYSISWSRTVNKNGEMIVLEIPLQNSDQIEIVRTEISEHIEKAISDSEKLSKAVKRQLGETVFYYQTLEQIVTEALDDIGNYGAPLSEADYKKYKQLCIDPEYVSAIYKKYFAKEKRGEFCALPNV